MARDAVRELVSLLSRWPGIGERTATRLAFHVLESDPEHAARLGECLATLHARVKRCRVCGTFDDEDVCRICTDPRRDATLVCVVSRVQDQLAMERTGSYRGRYHVLHGLVSPLDGVGAEALSLPALRDRCLREGVKEVVVATPLHVEGEATALYVREALEGTGVLVSRIASGMPHGGELEYADQVTLGRAFDGRRPLT